jgi:hypothetical protein
MKMTRLVDPTGTGRGIVLYGIFQFFILTFLAAFLYPGGYDYFSYYFSDLGTVIARNGEGNFASAALFFIALTTISVTLVPFWLMLPKLFSQSRNERALSRFGSLIGLICSPLTLGVALFPIDTQLEIHFILVLLQFSLFSIVVLLYSVAILIGRKQSSHFGFFGLAMLAIAIVLMIDPMGPFAALLQKVVVYCYFLWVGILMHLFKSKERGAVQ